MRTTVRASEHKGGPRHSSNQVNAESFRSGYHVSQGFKLSRKSSDSAACLLAGPWGRHKGACVTRGMRCGSKTHAVPASQDCCICHRSLTIEICSILQNLRALFVNLNPAHQAAAALNSQRQSLEKWNKLLYGPTTILVRFPRKTPEFIFCTRTLACRVIRGSYAAGFSLIIRGRSVSE
jgi:hypothetical protein